MKNTQELREGRAVVAASYGHLAPHPSTIPPSLAAIARGRTHIKTPEFAHAFSRANQTVLKNHCLTGECFGIRPIKVGKLLLWPVADIAALLNGGANV